MYLCSRNLKLNEDEKDYVFVACSSLLLSSCDTYTGSGAYAGATFGSILGSAIGGLSGGPRGSDMGTIIGMAGGAAVGAAIGSQADQNPSSKENLFIEIDHTVIIILIRTEFTSNLHLFIPMTKSLILLILVMIGFMISMIEIIPEVTVLSSLLPLFLVLHWKNLVRIMLIHHL